MTKQRTHRELWVLTSAAGLSLACSFGAALVPGNRVFAPAAAISAGVALAAWGMILQRQVLPLTRLTEILRRGGDVRSLKAASQGEASLLAAELIKAKTEQARALETCYSLAAFMAQAKHTMEEVRAEIGDAIDGVNGDCVELSHLLARLRNEAVSAATSGGLARERTVFPDVSAEIRSAVEEAVSRAEGISQVLGQMRNDAKTLLGSVDETTYSISRLDTFLEDMTRSGKALETSTENATRVVIEGTKAFEELEMENEALIVSVKDAGAAVDDLDRWSEEVGKIVEVIQDITDETNLLALNAAIIAAQAGEHGKAFGVVAEEIRGLAERTSSSTKEISDLVKSVQKNVSNVAQSMKKSLECVERGEVLARNAGRALEKVSESFDAARSQAKEMAASTSEHRLDSGSVVKSIHKVTDIARRLETNGIGDGAGAGASTVTARVLGALAAGEASRVVARAEEVGRRQETRSAACSVEVRERGVDTAQVIDRSEVTLEKIQLSLKSIRDRVSACIDVTEQAVDLTRSLVGSAFPGDGEIEARCWEIVGCREELRDSCQAYAEDDWRCFLLDSVACGHDADSQVHGGRRCCECPAFRSNLDRLLAGARGEHSRGQQR